VFPDPGIVTTPAVSEPWAVEKVVATITPAPPVEGSSSPVPYFHALERLKTNKREGWRRFGIDRYVYAAWSWLASFWNRSTDAWFGAYRGESIADHMYRMSMISLCCPPSLKAKIDMEKCMKMCLIHDMAESIVGDITPVDGVSKPEKSRREAETMDYLSKNLLGKVHGGMVGRDIREIWQEYEDSKTLDSHFVHDVDKIELLLQMVEYEKRTDRKLDLGEFAYVATKVVLAETQEWAQEILRERDEFWGGKAHVHGESGTAGGVSNETATQQDAYYNAELRGKQ
jgi:putative hydrolases of HD superfamily